MKLFYNNNDLYGDAGPHEAESKEALADEYEGMFREWAREVENEADTSLPFDEDAEVDRMRKEFIAGLEEVSQ